MANLNYQYDDPDSSGGSGSSRGRFIALFVLISVAIGGGLYYFWPKGETPKTVVSPTGQDTPAPTPVAAGPEKRGGGSATPVSVAPSGTPDRPPVATTPITVASGENTVPPPSDKGVSTPPDDRAADVPAVPDAPEPTAEARAALEKARGLLRDGKAAAAAVLAQTALTGTVENSKFYREVWQVLSDAHTALAYSGAPGAGNVKHTIRSGETLGGIARRYYTTPELLRRVNGVKNDKIFVGRTLVATPGDWKIRVEKRARLLKLYRVTAGKATPFLVREAGIGRFGKTPTAVFAISARVRHPHWYLPDGRIFKYGEPENQLGDYFLKLAPVKSPERPLAGYGLHGSRDENTVGRSLSNGCVRMRNAEIEALYYLVPSGCRVEIVE